MEEMPPTNRTGSLQEEKEVVKETIFNNEQNDEPSLIFQIGTRVHCRDFGGDWLEGQVCDIINNIPKVKLKGALTGHFWDEVEIIEEDIYSSPRFFILNITESMNGGPICIKNILESNNFNVDISDDVGELIPGYHKVLIVPGGNAKAAQFRMGEFGENHIRQFISQGGGYVGFCAGAYLGSHCSAQNADESRLGLLDVKWTTKPWEEFLVGEMTLNFSESEQNFTSLDGKITCEYRNGPYWAEENIGENCFTIAAVENANLPASAEEYRKFVEGKSAIVGGNFGNGRVVLCGPHPETTSGLEDLTLEILLSVLPKESKTQIISEN